MSNNFQSPMWQATLSWLVEECGLDAAGTETMVRLAATVADDHRLGVEDPYRSALASFSEPDEVGGLADSVAARLYPDLRA